LFVLLEDLMALHPNKQYYMVIYIYLERKSMKINFFF
jgi:hypothetical protein